MPTLSEISAWVAEMQAKEKPRPQLKDVARFEPEQQQTQVKTPPLFGPGAPPAAPTNNFSEYRGTPTKQPVIGPVPPPPENPYYLPGELQPGADDSIRIGGDVDELNYKQASTERGAQMLWKDRSTLKTYYNTLKNKGVDDDTIEAIMLDLAKTQKTARAEQYKKPVELQVTED